MNARQHALLGAMVALLSVARGQDAHFTQFYAQPTYLSPAFAGTSMQSRLGLTVRDQWPSIPGAFVTYNAAYDHYLSNMSSGVGVMVNHDRAGSGALRYTNLAVQYAYEIQLKRKVFLRPALQFGMVEHAVDLSRLTFGDQLIRGGDISTYEHVESRSTRYADLGAGALFFTPTTWLGVAFHHLNEPNQSLLLNQSKVPMRLGLHGGRRFHIKAPVIREKNESIVAAFNYRAQGRYDQLDLGAYYEREPFFAGLWYRGIPLFKSYAPGYGNSDALAVLIGILVKDMRIGYSYDITISRLAGRTAGAHELTLGYEWADRRKRRSIARRRVVPCAKF